MVKTVLTLNKMAKINGKNPILLNSLKVNEQINDKKIYTMLDLFKYKSLRYNTYAGFVMFFVNLTVFTGTEYSMRKGGLNQYINLLVLAITETMSYVTVNFYVESIKRKKIMIFSYAFSFVFSFSFLFLEIPDECLNSICH